MKNTNEISVSENICTENNYVKNNYTYTTTITLEECRMIEQRVKEEIQAHGSICWIYPQKNYYISQKNIDVVLSKMEKNLYDVSFWWQ